MCLTRGSYVHFLILHHNLIIWGEVKLYLNTFREQCHGTFINQFVLRQCVQVVLYFVNKFLYWVWNIFFYSYHVSLAILWSEVYIYTRMIWITARLHLSQNLVIPIEQRIHPRFADWRQIAVHGQKPFKKKICVLCIHRFDVFTEWQYNLAHTAWCSLSRQRSENPLTTTVNTNIVENSVKNNIQSLSTESRVIRINIGIHSSVKLY